ncbi:MAG TPA: hypothetical protein VMT18_10740 [Planctomycetota bacterium]|nr:hypothetical protein [Planctomycetota bacterium]
MSDAPTSLFPFATLQDVLAAAGLVMGVVLAIGLWVAIALLRELRGELRRLSTLESIEAALARLTAQRGDLDLRRIEHVLIELRDGGRRLEDAWLAAGQSPRAAEGPERHPVRPASLAERVTNRLLALGYERVRLVTTPAELAALAAEPGGGDGEIVVEARRAGAPCKGRVLLRAGALTEVEVRSAYTVFP